MPTIPTSPPLTSLCDSAHASLRDSAFQSPPSTILLSQDKLSQITNPLVQRSIIIQILRFVSPHPWGSRTAEAFRKSVGLDRIVASLFNPSDYVSKRRLAFSAGSHVLWTPVYIRPDGQLKHEKPVSGADGWIEAWLASRLPPYRYANGPSGLKMDITSLVLDRKSSTNPVEVLYDNRFVLSFILDAIPEEVLEQLRTPSASRRLIVAPTKKYFLPRLAFRVSNGNALEDINMSPSPSGGPATDASGICGHSFGAGWANWRLARVLE